jgi:broad specificity phosphatase PhoE
VEIVATAFVIVQHAEKEGQPGDPGLTVSGHRQAAAAARSLIALAPVAIYSSPLRRAVETAARIAADLDMPVVQDPALTERMNWTDDSGMMLEQFLEEWEAATRDRQYQPRCGDSSAQAGARFEKALLRYADRHSDGTVVVVTHGGVTTDLLRTVVGDDPLRVRAPRVIEDGVPGGAFTTLRRTSSDWIVDSVATVGHIAPVDRTGYNPA